LSLEQALTFCARAFCPLQNLRFKHFPESHHYIFLAFYFFENEFVSESHESGYERSQETTEAKQENLFSTRAARIGKAQNLEERRDEKTKSSSDEVNQSRERRIEKESAGMFLFQSIYSSVFILRNIFILNGVS
jgi:hypothetical protein